MISKDQREQIQAFVGNKPMFDAVIAILQPSEVIADSLPFQDDAEYGRAVKAWVGARQLIRDRVGELVRIAQSNPQQPPRNEAR